jgi:membrane protein YdbS with pleckstrin-like domain
VLVFFSWTLFPIIGVIGKTILGDSYLGIIIFGLVFYTLLVIIIAEIYARMTYNRWFYEFTPTNLKLERGIIWKRYSNVPYERVQNVDIHRGVLARMLGFSTVDIQTAGFSYGRRGRGGAEGHLPAINPERSEEIREFLIKKISKKHGQGM